MVDASPRRSRRAWAGVLLLTGLASAHGGTYAGPGGNPSSGYPMGPSAPTGPVGPGAPTAPPPGAAPAATGGVQGSGDASSWQFWWSLHRAAYLELRRALRAAPIATGDEDAFLGLRGAVSSPNRPGTDPIRDRVVPVLLAAAAHERNPDVLTGAFLALAKLGEERVDAQGRIPALLCAHLGDSNQEVAESAALGLGILGAPSAAPTLAALVRDDASARAELGLASVPMRTRAFAGYALGLLGMRQRHPDLRRYCAQALCRVIDEDRGTVPDLRVAATLALGLLPVEPMRLAEDTRLGASVPTASRADQVAWLLRFLADARQAESFRAQIPVSLARLLHEADERLRETVVPTLQGLVGPRSSASAALQQAAVTALGLLGDNDEDPTDRAVAQALRQAAHQGDRYARRLACIALARVGARNGRAGGRDVGLRNARGFLVDELNGDDGQARPWAALALGLLEHERRRQGESPAAETTAALRSALARHPGPTEAGAYCVALGLCQDLSARESIQAFASRTLDEEVQSNACIALGLLGERASVGPLRDVVLAARHRPLVLRDASIALGLLGDHELVPLLVGWLRDGSNVGQLSATATAIGWVGDQRAIEPLCALVESKAAPDRARAFAAVALGLVCEKDLLPCSAVYARDVVWWLAPATLFDPITGTGILDLL